MLLYIVMKHQHLQNLLLVTVFLHIVEDFPGSIVSEMVGHGRGCVGGNTTSVSAVGIGEDGLSFVDSVQQYRFGGCVVSVDGAWLTPNAAGAYPNQTRNRDQRL